MKRTYFYYITYGKANLVRKEFKKTSKFQKKKKILFRK